MLCIKIQLGIDGLSYITSAEHADKAVTSELELLFTGDIDFLIASLIEITEEEFNSLPDYSMNFLKHDYENLIVKEYCFVDEEKNETL